jgi:hypothetical protein
VLNSGAPVELWVTPGVAPGSIPRQTDDSELGGPRRKLRSFSPMPSGTTSAVAQPRATRQAASGRSSGRAGTRMAAGFAPLDAGFGSAGERSRPAGPALVKEPCASRFTHKSRGDPQLLTCGDYRSRRALVPQCIAWREGTTTARDCTQANRSSSPSRPDWTTRRRGTPLDGRRALHRQENPVGDGGATTLHLRFARLSAARRGAEPRRPSLAHRGTRSTAGSRRREQRH